MAIGLAAGRTETGTARQVNEDAFRLYHDNPDFPTQARGSIFVVADGMGAYRGGSMASSIAVDQLANYYQVPRGEFQADKTLEQLLFRANEVIANMRTTHKEYYGMGTTACAILADPSFRQGIAYYAGDSPIYMVRGGRAMEATQAQVSSNGELTNHLGMGDGFSLEKVRVALKPGDAFLLCSDGLSGVISPQEIGETLSSDRSAEECVNQLVDEALKTSRDNVTAIVLKIQEAQ